MYKFNAQFRKSAAAVATELGLEFISTKRQIENGTLMFNDPQSNVEYALYESGYVRRLDGQAMYQLNKTRMGIKTTTYKGKEYTHYQKIRVLANPDEQLGIFVKSVVNWRNRA